MKTKEAIETRLAETTDFYEGRRDMLQIPDGKVQGDAGLRHVVLQQMLQATAEIEILEWVLSK